MRKPKREINIFSMAALDLFASGLGAFILIAVIALPYYLKTDRSLTQEIGKLQQQLEQAQAQIAELSQQNQQLRQDNQRLEQENQQLRQESQQLEKQLQEATTLALLGITTKANSFVVLVDMSGSMQKYTKIMQSTIGQLLEPLGAEHAVQIIGFQGSGNLRPWQRPRNMASMDSANKSQALRLIATWTQNFSGGTPTRSALLEALNYASEAIILLTDGKPDGDHDSILREVTRANGGSKEIHTIAIGDYRSKQELVDFLEALAKANGGGFLGVANK